jgi:glutathione-regulated potassium-efflux system protein KefB
MEDHAGLSLLHDGVPLLGFALVFVLIFRRLGLGATLGFLVAGAVVGPQLLGLVGDAEGKLGIAELGIALLLFLVGLELSPSRLWRMRRDIFGLGLMQVTLCGLAVTGIVWVAANSSLAAALALGLPLALSSTAQVLPLLQSAGRLRTPFGERAFAILLFQDLSIVPLITIVAAMSRNPADLGGPPGWLLAVYTVVAIVGLILAGRYVLRPAFRLIGNLGEREMFVFAGLFTVIASAAIMEMLGLSAALGAFIAGVMLADSPYRHELEADVEPFRAILLGLFFLAVGMTLNLHAIAERPLFVAGMALALIATKAVLIMGLGKLFGMKTRPAFALGVLLSQGGEFGFVLFAQAQAAMLITGEAASIFGAIVTLSMATTPFLMMATKKLRTEPERSADRDGGATGRGIERSGGRLWALRPDRGADADRAGDPGDDRRYRCRDDRDRGHLRDEGLLWRRHADRHPAPGGRRRCRIADVLPGRRRLDTEALEGIHHAFPKATIFVRAYDRRSVMKMKGAPIAGAVREMLESAIVMARRAMDAVGVTEQEIDKTEAEYRRRDFERLTLQRETGDIRAGIDGMLTHASQAAAAEADLELK